MTIFFLNVFNPNFLRSFFKTFWKFSRNFLKIYEKYTENHLKNQNFQKISAILGNTKNLQKKKKKKKKTKNPFNQPDFFSETFQNPP